MNVLDMIAARLGENNVTALSQKLGTDRQQTLTAVAHSFPVMLKGLAQNSSQREGAYALVGALDKDHDGSILANLGSVIQNPAAFKGAGILNHVFGETKADAAKVVATKSGVSTEVANSALEVVAPMVMGFVGKKKKAEGLDAAGVAKYLFGIVMGGGASKPAADASPASGMLGGLQEKLGGMGLNVSNMGGLVDQAKGFIDKDKDGDVMDDLQGMLGGLFGGK